MRDLAHGRDGAACNFSMQDLSGPATSIGDLVIVVMVAMTTVHKARR